MISNEGERANALAGYRSSPAFHIPPKKLDKLLQVI